MGEAVRACLDFTAVSDQMESLRCHYPGRVTSSAAPPPMS
jgi:hypothetical protein